jgi:predicted MFS family arabinose efflux permease
MGNKFGPAIGAPVSAWLIVNHSWQLMFVATGAIGVLWLMPWLWLVSNDWPKGPQQSVVKGRYGYVKFSDILASPVVWGGLINNFCYGYFTFYCMTWMPAYLVEQRGLSLKESGVYTFFSFAGIAIVAAVAGRVADAIIGRGNDPVFVRKAFVIAGFMGGCTVLLGIFTSSLGWALFWNVFSLSFLGLATANNLALCRLTLIPPQAIGLVTGVQQVATSLAGGVAATLSGWLLHVSGSYDLPMMVIFVFLVIGAAATAILLRREWAPRVTPIVPPPETASAGLPKAPAHS